MGFAWAFMQAGAQNVIATLWDEDGAVSPALMRVLYREMAAGKTPASALRAAKLAVMRSSTRYRLPYYWGPLQVFTRNIGQ
jgi:CHAT domain-containing protein